MTSYGAKIASIPDSLEALLDLYDEGQLPPDDIIEMAQQLIDIDLDDYLTLTQYQQFCDYCIAEGMCYDVESEWGEVTDWSTLQVDDVILFRLYVNPLGGSYSAPRGAAPNHGGIYLGDGFMLHHPYNATSMIADLEKEGNRIWNTSCIGAIRKKST